MSDLRNIVLVGFMGTGKSRVGQILAKRLGRRFVDMDHEIVRREGRPIAEIFEKDGEAAFRLIERDVVRELSKRSNLVVSTGGGVVLDPSNLADFSSSGVVVCLKASPETVLERVGADTHRPLLRSDDRLERIRELLAQRQSLYDAIPLGVVTDGLDAAQVADEVIRLLGGR